MARSCPAVKLLALFFALAAAAPAQTWARQARLAEMAASNTGENLVLFLKVEGAFTEKMNQAIMNGVNTSFSFVIVLEQLTPFFLPNITVEERKVTHTVKYEAIKERFTVRRSWENDRIRTTDSFEEARRWM
ncbi:MAG: DUF4390 domain-containing protein, partial [Desulfosalsimonas sp.]